MSKMNQISDDENRPVIIKIRKKNANKIIIYLKEKKILNNSFKILSQDNFLLIPIEYIPNNFDISNNYEIIEPSSVNYPNLSKSPNNKRIGTLKGILKNKIPEKICDLIPRSFDIIGDIAILELNREIQNELRDYSQIIGTTILEIHKNIQSVYEKDSDIGGIFRTRKLKFIAGKKLPVTIHKENFCLFKMDIEKTFFTPRLSFERNRIAQIESEYNFDGWIWDMFCGIGPFIIQIAKKYRNCKFIGTDINPTAIKYANINQKLNKCNNIEFFNLDITQILGFQKMNKYQNSIRRIIMNLPEKNLEFLKFLPKFIHPDGTLLHIYQFSEKEMDPLMNASIKLNEKLLENNMCISKNIFSRIVKPFSPALETTVLDVIIKNKKL